MEATNALKKDFTSIETKQRSHEYSSVKLDLPQVKSKPIVRLHGESVAKTIIPKEDLIQFMAHKMNRDDLIELKIKSPKFPIIHQLITLVLSML